MTSRWFALLVTLLIWFLWEASGRYKRSRTKVFFLPGIAVALSSAYNPNGRIIKSSAGIPIIRFAVRPGLLGKRRRLAGLTVAALCASSLFAFVWRPVLASWYANIGAVDMAQAELRAASASFNRSLQLNPQNATAQYRLGLISYERNDFARAILYLELAPFNADADAY